MADLSQFSRESSHIKVVQMTSGTSNLPRFDELKVFLDDVKSVWITQGDFLCTFGTSLVHEILPLWPASCHCRSGESESLPRCEKHSVYFYKRFRTLFWEFGYWKAPTTISKNSVIDTILKSSNLLIIMRTSLMTTWLIRQPVWKYLLILHFALIMVR